MNQGPQVHAVKPEWDTPQDGDFARYVERLTAAHRVTLPEEPGRVLHAVEAMRQHRAPAAASRAGAAVPGPARPTLATALRWLLPGFLLLVVLAPLVSLTWAGLGPVLLLVIAVLAWWLVGRWRRTLAELRQLGGAPGGSPLAALQRELQALAQQKIKAGKAK